MIEFMKAAVKDGTDKISAKRIVVFILIGLLCIVIIGHMFFNKMIAEYIYNGLIEAVIWSMGFIGSEKFVEAIPAFMNNRRSNTRQPVPPPAPEENLI